MLHAHITPKSIKIFSLYSKISGVFIEENVFFTTYKMSTQYIICYSNSTQKTNHVNVIAVLITFNLIDVFFKTRVVFKSMSDKFDKVTMNTGIPRYFLI